MPDIFILNNQHFDRLTDAYEAAKDGDIIFCNFDILDIVGSMPEETESESE